MARKTLFFIFAVASLIFAAGASPHHQAQPALAILDRDGKAISRLMDGDAIRLQVKLANRADQPTPIPFRLEPDRVPVAECTVEKGSDVCQTALFPSLGWYWDKNKQPSVSRTIRANDIRANGIRADGVATTVQVAPRPVVLAHGFGSSAEAWTTFTGNKGLLASIGLQGFAVGDGQVPGRLNLGDLTNPTAKTGTLLSNAETLRDYIAAVKKLTGAQMVDLIAHSMGNLVSRYYIDRVMQGRDVAQMIMLGPPNLGTDCAYLPSSLGYYLPAALEIRPSYVLGIFNPQVIKRHGIPFTVIAGTPIVEQLASPCAGIPSDLAIALASASGIPAPVKQVDAWHSDLNVSPRVFDEYVKPLLQRSAGEFAEEPDPPMPTPPDNDLQFTRVFTGHVNSGASLTQTINIDNVAVASFALFDPTRSLTVTVRGASGNIVALDPIRNGLVVVKDPETLVYLGYGFNNPRPGPWQLTLQATDATPGGGADYALTAQLIGGAILKVRANPLLPKTGDPVFMSARLELAGQSLAVRDAIARIRHPDGSLRDIPFAITGGEWQANWTPSEPGLYGIDVLANGNAPDGTVIDRSAFLSIEAQPTADQFRLIQFASAILAGIIAVFFTIFIVRKIRGTRRPPVHTASR